MARSVVNFWRQDSNLQLDAKLFEGVQFLVEATHFEQLQLWREYHDRPAPDQTFIGVWKEESEGRSVTVGSVAGRPVCVSIFYATLDGVRVAFYEATSEVVDHKMIESWLRHHTEETMRWDGGGRWAHTDAQNFHHCLHYCLGVTGTH